MATRKHDAADKSVEHLTHTGATRKNIPTVEHQSVMQRYEQAPLKVSYPRGNNGLNDERAQRNPDLDPQLIWRGKDQQDWSNLIVNAPPLYIQEKVKPKVLIDDLRRQSEGHLPKSGTLDLFNDFNGLPEGADRTEFYQHEGHWQNRMILGDSLQVMASLAEREGLRGKVQCIYFDPPYGIKFNSNFQWSTTSRDVKDGNVQHITREPEQVKAFRDTWRDGIHSYLTYLRDRLIVARDLLSESGSIFVQIGDENMHRVRLLLDEVFGENNFCRIITIRKTAGDTTKILTSQSDYILWSSKNKDIVKYRPVFIEKTIGIGAGDQYDKKLHSETREFFRLTADESKNPENISEQFRIYRTADLRRQGFSNTATVTFKYRNRNIHPGQIRQWKTPPSGLNRLLYSDRLELVGNTLEYRRYFDDWRATDLTNIWLDSGGSGFGEEKVYVVQTVARVIQRCVLMTTDPGDLVLDPTCGSGTTAYVAEQWGRRWITIDTSRVALALARARIMGARYPFYLLADSPEGQLKEAEVTRSEASTRPTYGNITHGFVYQRVPHITLKAIANNTEIDVIWDRFELELAPLRARMTAQLPAGWLQAYRKTQKYTAEVLSEIQEWEVPRELPESWPSATKALHEQFWQLRIARQKEIDASIAAKADFEYLYDKPYEDKKKVRVAGPFTVESLSPHRVLGVDEEDNLFDKVAEAQAAYGQDFASLIMDNLRTAGVQQSHKEGRITCTAFEPWPGELVCGQGRYEDADGNTRRAGIFIGPEFGTVSRADLVDAAREAGDANFDVLIACAFSYDAQASEFGKLGRLNVLKARMNADLHMAEDLKNTGKGNLFVIFGEPDLDVQDTQGNSVRRYDGKRDIIDVPADGQLVVQIKGVDVFDPGSGEIRSDDPSGIACWFIDTDYNGESFFVRHAYFLGANDPYKALKTTLKAEIDADAWASLNSDTSRPFTRPASGRFAVKVINHLGDEVMKVFRVGQGEQA